MKKGGTKMARTKQVSIPLVLLIFIFIVIVGLMTLGITAIFKKDKNENNVVQENNLAQNQQEKPTIEVGQGADFDLQFLKMESNKQNMIYSPLSIKYALNMLNEGANGRTKTQIEDVISGLTVTKYDNVDKVMSLTNSLYIKNSYSDFVLEDFTDALTKKYNAEVRYDMFKNARNINGWIRDKTLNQIQDIVEDDMVNNEEVEMLLINALAIDMEWKEPFDTEKTGGSEFYLEDGTTMIATTMNQKTKSDNISYYRDDIVTALAIDLEKYEQNEFDFIAIMPNDNISNHISKFTVNDLKNIVDHLEPASKTKNGLDISIPKFSFDYNLKLKDDLKSLGITYAFDKNLADFTKMSTEGIYVSDAIHKANIDFTEKGVKAAAVTVLLMNDTAMMIDGKDKPIEVKINKPFIYIIRDKNTNELWFVGTVYTPNSWEEDRAEYQGR